MVGPPSVAPAVCWAGRGGKAGKLNNALFFLLLCPQGRETRSSRATRRGGERQQRGFYARMEGDDSTEEEEEDENGASDADAVAPQRRRQLSQGDSGIGAEQPRTKRSKTTAVTSAPAGGDNWRQQALAIVDALLQEEMAVFFAEPVDLETYTDYLDVIAQPMDFGTVRKSVTDSTKYSRSADFLRDMNLVFSNAYTYNKTNDE